MDIDYLVVGAGATAMAFVDVIVSHTDKTVAMVDRRDAPGGHWNDAYPFVRLHQASAFYGVASKELGQGRRAARGLNAGMLEMASKPEILQYYSDLMENTFLASGRVQYFPQSEERDGRIVSLLRGEATPVTVKDKTVQAGMWGDRTTIPATHMPNFDVATGVAFGPVNDLPRRAAQHRNITVIGAGKTGMDAVLWLLEHGMAPERISWVRPNDYWLFNRDTISPDPATFETTINSQIAEMQSLATAQTVREHVENLEKAGRWHRIDRDVWPMRFHAAVCSEAEIDALRSITNVHRLGHVKAIEPGRLVMERGAVTAPEDTLYIDCTGRGGVVVGTDIPPVFAPDEIHMFMVRPFQPTFSAALIGFLEATIDDDATKNAMTRVTDFHDTPAQFLGVQMAGFANQYAWNQTPDVRDWIDRCRLNAGSHLMAGLGPQDTDKMALLGQLGPLTVAAMKNLPKLLSAG